MACIFDMRRLHHGCGESLLVRPLKPECIAKAGTDEQQQISERMKSAAVRSETEKPARHWE